MKIHVVLRLHVVSPTLPNFSMSANWDLYLFCQEKKRNENEYGEILYSKIATQLKKFIEIDATSIELGHLDDRTRIAKTLETHNAV